MTSNKEKAEELARLCDMSYNTALDLLNAGESFNDILDFYDNSPAPFNSHVNGEAFL